jgi:ribosomal protein L31
MNTDKFKCPICGSDSCSCTSTSGDDDYKGKVHSIFRGRQKFIRNTLFNDKFKVKFKFA